MALKIRLRQQGKTNRLMYRLVVIEQNAARDGRYVEMLGWYNPHTADDAKRMSIAADRVAYWLSEGADISPQATSLMKVVAPQVIKDHTAKQVTARAKALTKRKERKARQAAA